MRFGSEMLRQIYAPTKLTDGAWTIETDEELDNLIKHKNMIDFIKAQRLRWLGHVERMPEERDVKEIYKRRLIASSPVGRWMDNVMRGIQAMETVSWKR
jgi:hypothetical protein